MQPHGNVHGGLQKIPPDWTKSSSVQSFLFGDFNLGSSLLNLDSSEVLILATL